MNCPARRCPNSSRPSRSRAHPIGAPLLLALGLACWPALGRAQSAEPAPGPWRFAGTLYVYVPSVDGSTTVPADPGGGAISFDVIQHLKMTLMGTLDAHNGRWGAFTDFVYLDFGNAKDHSRDFSIGNAGLSAGTDAHIDWDLKGLSWTVGGQYRLLGDPAALTLDAIGGARLLDIRLKLNWNISGDIGNLQPAGRSGSSNSKLSQWDGIVGLKGRYAFGRDSRWSAPLYLDVGAGESKLTWQVAGGIGYAFSWGEATALWRYLAYEMKPGQSVLKDIQFNGPMVGATFRW